MNDPWPLLIAALSHGALQQDPPMQLAR